MIIHV